MHHYVERLRSPEDGVPLQRLLRAAHGEQFRYQAEIL